MFHKVIVVCVGNICRSPVGERLLAQKIASRGGRIEVSSAGLSAVVGHGVDAMAGEVAEAQGMRVEHHVARQFTAELGQAHDLILVMEAGHRAQLMKEMPSLSGRIMLFDHWVGAKGIADPYHRSKEFHLGVFRQLDAAADAWARKLAP